MVSLEHCRQYVIGSGIRFGGVCEGTDGEARVLDVNRLHLQIREKRAVFLRLTRTYTGCFSATTFQWFCNVGEAGYKLSVQVRQTEQTLGFRLVAQFFGFFQAVHVHFAVLKGTWFDGVTKIIYLVAEEGEFT